MPVFGASRAEDLCLAAMKKEKKKKKVVFKGLGFIPVKKRRHLVNKEKRTY